MNTLLAMWWILDDEDEPQQVDVLTWARWLEAHPDTSRVLRETVAQGVDVSTVFLGLNAAYFGGPPILWETMIFGGPFDRFQRRYTSKLDALEGHAQYVRLVTFYLHEAPRKTKKALGKWGGTAWPRLKPREQRRLLSALRAI